MFILATTNHRDNLRIVIRSKRPCEYCSEPNRQQVNHVIVKDVCSRDVRHVRLGLADNLFALVAPPRVLKLGSKY